jgi:DNA ligase-1
VVIGANMGEGRRSGLYGTLLLAALNEETGNFEMVTKVSSGMTDETANYFYNNLTRTNVCPKTVRSNEEPDQWLVPDHVLEIAGDEITESKDSVVGYSIRFPRILRIRNDKGIEDITTVKEIRAMS